MKVLAVVSPSLYKKIEDKNKYLISIDNLKIPIAFVQVNPPEFNSSAENFNKSVLVKKVSFSLNFRDLGVMELAWNRISTNPKDSFYPIGSDFAGYIEAVGKDVTSFKQGDLVLGNSSYPIGEEGSMPGVPSNHASREYEIYHFGKLLKVPPYISATNAGAMSIGVQTAMSMIRKANIKEKDNVLITSITSNTSFFLLNTLWDKNCNVYGLSYSGKNTKELKKHFTFIKEIYIAQEDHIPKNLMFDVVLDPFSDTYIDSLVTKLNMDATYITCGIFNQSGEKMAVGKTTNLSLLIANLIMKNANLISNCLGTTQDLVKGLKLFKNHKMVIDEVFTESNSLESFMTKTYNIENNKFGKVVYQYQ